MPNKNHYREKLLEEIQTIPQEMTPVLYKIVHLLNVQWVRKKDVKRRTINIKIYIKLFIIIV